MPRTTFPRTIASFLTALHFYGAAGIAAFGWAMAQVLDWPAEPWLGLWFCAGLFIYNADRLRGDPADLHNVPLRAANSARFRRTSFAVALLAGLYLIVWPIVRGDWMTLGLVIGGGLICLNYTFPLLGFRWKDVPLLKSFFAPIGVLAAILGLPLLHHPSIPSGGALVGAAAWGWTILQFNMLLCDQRDRAGDAAVGLRSVPVVLGDKRTGYALLGLIGLMSVLAFANWQLASHTGDSPWRYLLLFGTTASLGLYLQTRRPQPESFYEWFVEGLLFVPAASVLAAS